MDISGVIPVTGAFPVGNCVMAEMTAGTILMKTQISVLSVIQQVHVVYCRNCSQLIRSWSAWPGDVLSFCRQTRSKFSVELETSLISH